MRALSQNGRLLDSSKFTVTRPYSVITDSFFNIGSMDNCRVHGTLPVGISY